MYSVCLFMLLVSSLYLGEIEKIHIYFPSSIFRTSTLENFILHKYIVANPSGHTVKGVGCNYFISEIACSNPADGMDVFVYVL